MHFGEEKKEDNIRKKIDHLYQQFYQFYKLGQYAEAIKEETQIRELIRLNFGENHPDYADSLNNLGLVYVEINDYAEAERLFKQALEIRRRYVRSTPSWLCG